MKEKIVSIAAISGALITACSPNVQQSAPTPPAPPTQYKEVTVIHKGAGEYCGTGYTDAQFQQLLSQGWRVTSKSVVQGNPKYNYPTTCVLGYYSLEK